MESAGPRARSNARERQREDTRQRVYEAALEIFRRDGVDGARIADITQLAGVSHGTFYFHFPTKDDVLLELLHASELRVVTALEALADEAPVGELLAVVATTIAREWEADAGLFPSVGAVGLRSMASRVDSPDSSPTRAALGERFARAAAREELSGLLPPSVLADIYLTHLFAAMMSWCSRPTLPLETVLSGVSMLFLYGARGDAA